MPINTDLNVAPYFDDFGVEKQYYKVLFKPGFAVQAREMTQLQTMLQNQIEQFGDNIFKEGSIIKGCNFTALSGLSFVKLSDAVGFDPTAYISKRTTEKIDVGNGEFLEIEVDYVYEVVGKISGVSANIISASRGFETRSPDLNTFYIQYTNTNEGSNAKTFNPGEELTINLTKFKVGSSPEVITDEPDVALTRDGVQVTVTNLTPHQGSSYGIQSSPGVVFQKGHFLFASEQTLIVSKYTNVPNEVSVGYRIKETLKSALQDNTLYDNANDSPNENAPGADRLELIPELVALDTTVGDEDPTFFALIRYQNGNEVTLRDVSQYNVLGEEMARRTFEESGNYILNDFMIKTDRRGEDVNVLVGTGTAYVKGYRVENSAERSFPISQISQTEVQKAQPINFNYGQYVDIDTISGSFNLDGEQLDLLNSSRTKIGTAFASNITQTIGTTNQKIYLYGVRMNSGENFSSVEIIDSSTGSNGEISVVKDQIKNTAVLKDTNKGPLIFDTGMFSIKSVTDTTLPVRAIASVNASGDTLTIPTAPDENFNLDNSDVVVVDSNNVSHQVNSVSISGAQNLVITLESGSNPSSPCKVYHNKNLRGSVGTGQEPYIKQSRETFVKFNFNSSETKYSLGFPDVYEVVSILDPNDNEYVNSFRLKTNQKDFYYDRSYVEYVQGKPKPPVGELRVTLKVFEVNTGAGKYFFNISSYSESLPESSIPVYTATNGEKYNLRECFDFRPYVDKDPAAQYSGVDLASAPLIDTGELGLVNVNPTFNDSGTAITPAVNQSAFSDLEYYLTRIDLIVANSYGEINLIKGKEEKFAVPPKVDADSLVISEIKVPGFPALSSKEATEQERRSYAIKARPVGSKNYTMKDIGALEKKIDRLEYYVSLNQLESETADLTILDENGQSRFKNGFVADPFNDFTLANIKDTQFNAAISFNKKTLTPSVKTFPLDLVFKSGDAASVYPTNDDPKVASLFRDKNVDIISQPFASEFRNAVSNFYKYDGQGDVSPPYDAAYDTVTNPLTLDIDLTSAFEDLVDNIQEFIPLTDVSRDIIVNDDLWGPEVFRNRIRGFNRGGFQQTLQEQTTTRNITSTPTVTENTVGEFVTDFRFQPYMASRDIKVYMTGLRPSTRHYFFFDGVDVNEHVSPGTPVDNVNLVNRFGPLGSEIRSDSNGTLRCVFRIPAETFFVGDRVFEIVDVDSYDSIDSASTSRGFVTYRAYSFSVEKASLTTSTRAPDFDIAATTTTRNLPRRATGGRDPLAQTFFIKEGMGAGSKTVFVSNVDIFFKRKAPSVNGVTVMLREVVNGYPSNQIVPFSKVHLLPSEVNVSDDASIPTTFTFNAPVRLDVEKEYAVVIQPDASDPNYLVFTSKVGGVDLTPGVTQGQAIVQDWGDGVLFTSTNNRAWKSYQDEDIKFTLRRHDFNAPNGQGSVKLTINNPEFFTVKDITGKFKQGEVIYQLKGSSFNGASMTLGSNVLSLPNVQSNFSTGDEIIIRDSGNTRKDIFKIVRFNDANSAVLDRPSSYAMSGGVTNIIVSGTLSYYDKNNPSQMHLEGSKATTGRVFSNSQLITGFDSNSTAVIDSVDDIQLSYIQPMIFKANDPASSTLLSGTFVSPENTETSYELPMSFANNNHFNQNGAVIYSKSNDTNNDKEFDINIDMSNNGNKTSSPIIDIEASKILAYQYKITNDTNTTSKFISRTIELAEDLDAEDMNVILTGYRPTGTDIKVYIKPQNVFDSDDFDSLSWMELELFEGANTFSSTVNVNDYKEFKYKVFDSDKSLDGLTYTSEAGTFSGFRRFAVRIDMISDNIYNVPTLKDYRAIALT